MIWNGKVVDVMFNKTFGDPLLVINYWSQEKHEYNGEISLISISQLATDFFGEDL